MRLDQLEEAKAKAQERGKLLALLYYDPEARRREVGETLNLLDMVDGRCVVVGVEKEHLRNLPKELQVGLNPNLVGGKPPAVAAYTADGLTHIASLSSRIVKALGDTAVRDFKRKLKAHLNESTDSLE
ncbi:MAG: hypothetical protein RML49_07435 [Verrucomicrobiae bacterium]|nr:hypothetical protein [Verrucomicrobiae bacterium]